MEEFADAPAKRAAVAAHLKHQTNPNGSDDNPQGSAELSACAVDPASPLFHHLAQGLALTTGSALGSDAPSTEQCLAAFEVPNKAKLTAGARAWSKHAHRSQPAPVEPDPPDAALSEDQAPDDAAENDEERRRAQKMKKKHKKRQEDSAGWWGRPSGPVAGQNARATLLFWKIMRAATWRNLHWLPHQVLVYEARVPEGYGLRWAQDFGARAFPPPRVPDAASGLAEPRAEVAEPRAEVAEPQEEAADPPWVFRGFVEPMMENGHELGWRHAP